MGAPAYGELQLPASQRGSGLQLQRGQHEAQVMREVIELDSPVQLPACRASLQSLVAVAHKKLEFG